MTIFWNTKQDDGNDGVHHHHANYKINNHRKVLRGNEISLHLRCLVIIVSIVINHRLRRATMTHQRCNTPGGIDQNESMSQQPRMNNRD